jgi:hypothetical protein
VYLATEAGVCWSFLIANTEKGITDISAIKGLLANTVVIL